MDGIHVPTATAMMTAVSPRRPPRAAMPPKIGFASSRMMLVAPRAKYFHSRWNGDRYSAYWPAESAACRSRARIRAPLR
jgi:hypothetical protein